MMEDDRVLSEDENDMLVSIGLINLTGILASDAHIKWIVNHAPAGMLRDITLLVLFKKYAQHWSEGNLSSMEAK